MNVNDNLMDLRKRIGQYSYVSKDVIGKGYSSIVYKAKNDSNGKRCLTKDKQLPSNSSIWKTSKARFTKYYSTMK